MPGIRLHLAGYLLNNTGFFVRTMKPFSFVFLVCEEIVKQEQLVYCIHVMQKMFLKYEHVLSALDCPQTTFEFRLVFKLSCIFFYLSAFSVFAMVSLGVFFAVVWVI